MRVSRGQSLPVEKAQHSNTDGKLADHIVILAQEAEKVKAGSRVRL